MALILLTVIHPVTFDHGLQWCFTALGAQAARAMTLNIELPHFSLRASHNNDLSSSYNTKATQNAHLTKLAHYSTCARSHHPPASVGCSGA